MQSIASFVREDSAGNCCQNASKIGYKNVDKSVVAANFQPSTKSPSKKVRTLKHSTNAVIGVCTFGMIVLVIYSGIICVVGKSDNATYREDYIIVLGAGLKGDTPSLALERRLEKAAEYMNKNGNAIAIVSGGQGKGETISEAQAMENYLLNHGIREDRIIKEDNSTSTYENFEYSKLIMDEGQAVFVTNEFHVLRSELMAKINGIDATHIGASTPITLLPVSCVREFIAQIAAVRYYF